MPSQIESRIERLENSMGGAERVVVIFECDSVPVPESGIVIRVRFVSPGGRDAQ